MRHAASSDPREMKTRLPSAALPTVTAGFAVAVGIVWPALPLTQARATSSEINAGKQIADQTYSGCHQVNPGTQVSAPAFDDDNKPMVGAPSFPESRG
jgi:hypothetical protein